MKPGLQGRGAGFTPPAHWGFADWVSPGRPRKGTEHPRTDRPWQQRVTQGRAAPAQTPTVKQTPRSAGAVLLHQECKMKCEGGGFPCATAASGTCPMPATASCKHLCKATCANRPFPAACVPGSSGSPQAPSLPPAAARGRQHFALTLPGDPLAGQLCSPTAGTSRALVVVFLHQRVPARSLYRHFIAHSLADPIAGD